MKILVILHLYYTEQWSAIRRYLDNLSFCKWKMIVTCPPERMNISLQNEIQAYKNGEVNIQTYENKGYDIAPFLMALRTVELDDYDIVIKLQSKSTNKKTYIYNQYFSGRSWFVNLFEGILGKKTARKTIPLFENDPSVGLVAAKNLIVSDPPHKQHLVQRDMKKYGVQIKSDYKFVAGTCFAIRTNLLKPLVTLPITHDDFVPVPKSRGLSLAHVLERYICTLPVAAGYRLAGNEVMQMHRFLIKPIEYFCRTLSSDRLHKLPYIYDDEFFYWKLDGRFVNYREKKVRFSDLCVWEDSTDKLIPIYESVPYRYLTGNKDAYKQYCVYHINSHLPYMTEDRFNALIASMKEDGFDSAHIIMVSSFNMILDGLHRACWLAYQSKPTDEIDVLEIRWVDKKHIVTEMLPTGIRASIEKHIVLQLAKKK